MLAGFQNCSGDMEREETGLEIGREKKLVWRYGARRN
jgi:hypothetical protein